MERRLAKHTAQILQILNADIVVVLHSGSAGVTLISAKVVIRDSARATTLVNTNLKICLNVLVDLSALLESQNITLMAKNFRWAAQFVVMLKLI